MATSSGESSRSLKRGYTAEHLLDSFMNDSDSEVDRFDLGEDSGRSENEAVTDSEWEFESDEEQPIRSTTSTNSGELHDDVLQFMLTLSPDFVNENFSVA